MAVLKKPSIKDVKMNHLHKLRKMFNLSLLRGEDKYTHVRAVASSLNNERYIKIAEEANLASLTRDDISVVKTLDPEDWFQTSQNWQGTLLCCVIAMSIFLCIYEMYMCTGLLILTIQKCAVVDVIDKVADTGSLA